MTSVRMWLLNAPRWLLGLVNGTLVGLLIAAWRRFGPEAGWKEALLTGVIVGVLFGAGAMQYRQNRGLREAVADVPTDTLRRARRETWRGPVPEDPEVRKAAHALAPASLAVLERQRVWGPASLL